jgi:hypothetical protein
MNKTKCCKIIYSKMLKDNCCKCYEDGFKDGYNFNQIPERQITSNEQPIEYDLNNYCLCAGQSSFNICSACNKPKNNLNLKAEGK